MTTFHSIGLAGKDGDITVEADYERARMTLSNFDANRLMR